jgi:hypothetical protein
MQRKTFLRALATFAAVLAGCTSAPQVRVDQDPAVDLTSYRTFAFHERPGAALAGYSSLIDQRLKAATRAQMEQRGYTYSEQAPQLLVNVVLRVTDKQEIHGTPGRFGYRGFGGGSIDTEHYKAGTLRIDVVDAGRRALAWQGVAEGRLGDDTLQSPGPAVEKAVAEIFARWPIAPKG